MELFENGNHLDERMNSYKCNFFHMFLEGESPIINGGYNKIPLRDYASFIHEYVHYIQQITTPYGLKYSTYFIKNLLIYRESINSSQKEINLPFRLKVNEPTKQIEVELANKNGSESFAKGNINDIEINNNDVKLAKQQQSAVNIGVYDFENDRAFNEGFQFGYWCVIESMAHMVQSLINPELNHRIVPYRTAQLVCSKIRPDLRDDTKLLISICYVSLYFDNPGHAFFEILDSIPQGGEKGVELYKRYMIKYKRRFRNKKMDNHEMMNIIMNEFVIILGALVGNNLIYYKNVLNNCKLESSKGDSLFLRMIYYEDISNIDRLSEIISFYGYPAIDSSKSSDIVVPFDQETERPYLEHSSLISLELLINRFKEKSGNKVCLRFQICNRNRDNDIIEEFCAEQQWLKEKTCLFKAGLQYWGWEDKQFNSDK